VTPLQVHLGLDYTRRNPLVATTLIVSFSLCGLLKEINRTAD
jgi:hypothetical protein